eukprot:g19150.t1
MKGYLLIGYFCVAASYRQQLPAAGFAAELDSGERVRQILEPCEMVHLDIDVPRGNAMSSGLADLVVDGFGSGPDYEGILKEIEALSKDGPQLRVQPGIDHADAPIHGYGVLINPSTSDVLCTVTVEALAMGKHIVLARHVSNNFFERFKDRCHFFEIGDVTSFTTAVKEALAAGDPKPLSPDDRYTLTWEAAVERLFDSAEVRVLSGPFQRPSEAAFSRLAYDVHFGVMKDDTVLADIIRRTTFGEEEYPKELKIIVWAHNSHVGDATATPMGGMDFQRNEKWNLGQKLGKAKRMCRSNLESVFIVGFYAYCGEVRAAKKWGGEGQVMKLSAAVPYSFEHRLHEWFAGKSASFPLYRFRDASQKFEYVPLKSPLNIEYRAVHPMVRVNKDLHPNNTMEEEGSEAEALRHKHQTLDPQKSFIAVKRVQIGKNGEVIRLQIKGYDRGQYDGCWVTEYSRYGSRTIHCLPADHLNALSGQNISPEKLLMVANFPILQRWVGVQYHPETEIESHYGEMSIAKCYDLAVFVDKTQALNIDMTPAVAVTVSAALGEEKVPESAAGKAVVTASHNRRLMMEYRRILKNPIDFIEARPLDTNILEWHFVMTGNQDPYTGGDLSCILEFPDDFPMKPPSIKLLTPSGRFEINKRICLSMSDFHKESWNPSWTVEKILIGLMSFMYEENSVSIGSILEPKEDRRRYAAASAYFNAQNEIYVQLFQTPDEAEEEDNIRKLRKVAAAGGESESEKACRYCLSEKNGELMRQQRGTLAARLGHFTEAVYIISLCEPYNPNKRGGGAVLGVNLVQKVPDPIERTTRPLLNQGPDIEVTTYPLKEWRHHYAPLVQVLQQARVIGPGAVEHYLGGPVEPAEAFALIDLPATLLEAAKAASNASLADPGVRRQLGSCFELLSPQRIAQVCSRLRVKGSIYFGELSVILALLASVFVHVGPSDSAMLGDNPVERLRFELWQAPPSGATRLPPQVLADRVRGTVFGAALGDAAGLATEFLSHAEAVDFYGPKADFQPGREVFPDEHRMMWCAGDWTDDTDQQVLLMQSLLNTKGHADPCDFAARLASWRTSGFPELGDQSAAGLGQTTKLVLNDPDFTSAPHKAAAAHSSKTPSNGGVMRTTMAKARAECALSEEWDEEMQRHAEGELSDLNLDERKTIGYTFKCLGAGLWALRSSGSFESVLNQLILAAGDADTNGTVAVMDAVRLASLAREELTIFGAEVMLGAAICVGAALQRPEDASFAEGRPGKPKDNSFEATTCGYKCSAVLCQRLRDPDAKAQCSLDLCSFIWCLDLCPFGGTCHDEVRAKAVSAVDSLADRTDNKAAAALAARLQDAEAKVAEAAWAAIRKRLEDADPDVNRVWLEEIRCRDLNPKVHAEVIRLVLQNLTEHSWLIQMAATRALQLQQPAESREVLKVVYDFREDSNPSVREYAEEVYDHLVGNTLGDITEPEADAICRALSGKRLEGMMKRQLNRASTLPANKIVPPVARRPPQRSTTQANMGSVDENGGASATASVVVVARIRPKLPKEDKEPDGVEVYSDAQTLSIFNNGREKKQYTLDQVFDSRWRMQTARSARSNDSLEKSPRPSAAEQRKAEAAESQAKFFNDFGRNLVTHSLKGYNVCVFAYGHTGSGKTYTMLGDAAGSGRGAAAGLLPRFLIELFQEHEDAPRPDTWRCSCEFFEADLLNFAASAKKIQTKPVVNSKSATEKLAELENEATHLAD